MASELRVNTLKDASGNNSVGLSYVANGSAKAWCFFDGTQSTLSFSDSFNGSSLTDVTTGQYDLTMTSAMSNSTYPVMASVVDRNDNTATTPQATNRCRMLNRKGINGAAASDNDDTKCQMSLHGDLA